MMTDLGVSRAENEMEPRVVARISRERRSTSLSEPVRQVVAAWIVASLVLLAGLSVLAFHERDVCDNGAAVAVPLLPGRGRWQMGVAAGNVPPVGSGAAANFGGAEPSERE
jgi:hypothetical protein